MYIDSKIVSAYSMPLYVSYPRTEYSSRVGYNYGHLQDVVRHIYGLLDVGYIRYKSNGQVNKITFKSYS